MPKLVTADQNAQPGSPRRRCAIKPRSVGDFYVRHQMTAFAAVLSVLLAVALYAIVSFCRFPRMRLSALAEYASQPGCQKPNYALGFLFFGRIQV